MCNLYGTVPQNTCKIKNNRNCAVPENVYLPHRRSVKISRGGGRGCGMQLKKPSIEGGGVGGKGLSMECIFLELFVSSYLVTMQIANSNPLPSIFFRILGIGN